MLLYSSNPRVEMVVVYTLYLTSILMDRPKGKFSLSFVVLSLSTMRMKKNLELDWDSNLTGVRLYTVRTVSHFHCCCCCWFHSLHISGKTTQIFIGTAKRRDGRQQQRAAASSRSSMRLVSTGSGRQYTRIAGTCINIVGTHLRQHTHTHMPFIVSL
jgi:hypothetical protein